MGRGGRWERGSGAGGTFVYLWSIYVDLWQKPIQYCKAVIIQLKINFKQEDMAEELPGNDSQEDKN